MLDGNGLLWGTLLVGGGAYVDRVDVAVMVAVHVAIGEQAIGEEREEDEFGQSEKLIPREGEASAAVDVSWSDSMTRGQTNRRSRLMFSSEPVAESA